ncbi:CopD family protein [Nitrosomonas cryotolerans]|uniref:CopD family protein n=1 Tax=Nitrosomonas cryotolerans TaxID=44575 RepID=UPI000491F228|nr:CopD family protein [Nitrosomonas cryotolerans]
MIDVIEVATHWFQLAANLTLLGSCVFLAMTESSQPVAKRSWINRLEALFPWLGLGVIAGLIVILAITAGQATGNAANIWRPGIWVDFLENTRVGDVWVWRAVLAMILLGVILYLRYTARSRWHYVFCAIVATLPLIAGSLTSHSAAEELSLLSILPYALHIILAGVWLGALPAFLLLLFAYVKTEKDKQTKNIDIQVLQRFSLIALPAMLLIIASGIFVADRIFDGNYAALFATPYGWLLNIKLALLAIILVIAAYVRSNCLPIFTQADNPAVISASARVMRKWVRIEFVIALVLLLLATIIANTTPAKYAPIEEWPYPFRFSIETTWNDARVIIQVWTGIAILALAGGAVWLGKSQKWKLGRLIIVPLFLVITGFAVALPPLAIEAYPETYRRTPIPFDAVSIANGAALYAQYCVNCHGPQGKGNGIQSRTLSTVPTDMLTEPHTEEHTAGDFFHWISFGINDTEMPGYVDELSEDDRWDLVNFIHALSRGYQARILTPEVVPNRPYMVPPGFFYTAEDGSSGILADFRKQKSVLLVIFSWPESLDRLKQLAQVYDVLNDQNTLVLAVPKEGLDAETIKNIATDIPFPIVTEGASEIAHSYALSRRTFSRPDILGAGVIPDHMEFLIDRYGYLRARWIPPTENTLGWDDTDLLIKQVSLFNQEESILPPPDEYVN